MEGGTIRKGARLLAIAKFIRLQESDMTQAQPKLFPSGANDDFAKSSGDSAPSVFSTDVEKPMDDAERILADLRAEFEHLSSQVSSALRHQAELVSRGVTFGADRVADEIRREPVIAIGLATLFGVLVGFVVTHSASGEPTWQDTANRYQNEMKRELDTLLAKAQAVSREAQNSASGFMPTVERLVQNLSQMDVGSSIGPSLDKGASLFKSVWNSMIAPRS